MRMLHWMCGKTIAEIKLRNRDIRTRMGITPIKEKM